MSDLQLGLLAAGAVIVVLVLAYNKWQEHRMRKQGDATFGSRHDDVLLGTKPVAASPHPDQRVEPVMGPVVESAQTKFETAETPAATAREEQTPAVADADEVAAEIAAAAARETQAPPTPLDGSIDALAIIAAPAGGNLDAGPVMNADWGKFSKTVSLYGERDGTWSALAAGAGYSRILVGLQLVNRKGPLPGMELAVWSRLVGELAAAQGGPLAMAATETTSRQAADLDRLCADVDFLINIAVVAASDKPFVGTRIAAAAAEHGMVLAEDGSFQRRDREGNVLFTLKNRGATPFSLDHMREFSTRALALALDVPRVPRDAFPAMRSLAGSLCNALQGTIVDEQGNALDEAAMDRVARQLEAIHVRLDQAGISPGGALALRLFS